MAALPFSLGIALGYTLLRCCNKDSKSEGQVGNRRKAAVERKSVGDWKQENRRYLYRRSKSQPTPLSLKIEKSIKLPAFPSVGVMAGIDIGGTLSKIAVCCSDSKQAKRLQAFLNHSDTYGRTGRRDAAYDFVHDGVRIMFLKYETSRTSNALAILRKEKLISPGAAIGCTGGGAFRFSKEFQQQLHHEGWHKVDEMHSLVTGVSFLIQNVPKSIYTFKLRQEEGTPERLFLDVGAADRYPRLIVNVGSGVSVLLMETADEYKRVGGSSLGGGTFLGLAKLIAGPVSFDEALALARKGDSTKVDLLVGDIYGGHYSDLGLPEDAIAAFFGKMARFSAEELQQNTTADEMRRENLMAALLKLVTYSIATTAFLYSRIYHPEHIVFTGNFLTGNVEAEARIAYMVAKRSQGQVLPLFMARGGYFGAMGALLGAVTPDRSLSAPPTLVANTNTIDSAKNMRRDTTDASGSIINCSEDEIDYTAGSRRSSSATSGGLYNAEHQAEQKASSNVSGTADIEADYSFDSVPMISQKNEQACY